MNNIHILEDIIKKLNLDLKGLTVLAECASNAYAYTPIMAAMAGASVYSVGKDTHFGSFLENKRYITRILAELNLSDRVHFFENTLTSEFLSKIDIYLNSGHIRPINKKKILELKPTAVIPLMWEAFEFRPDEIDLKTCIEQNIPVIGCNENNRYFNLFNYTGYLALKMMYNLGLEIYKNSVLICGDDVLAGSIHKLFSKLELSKLSWISSKKYSSNVQTSYDKSLELIKENKYDVIIIADIKYKEKIISESGPICFSDLFKYQKDVKIAHIGGNIDINALKRSNIPFFPKKIAPVGYVSYQLKDLGNKPVFQLNALGLKVGEISARARLNGSTTKESIQKTVDYGLGQFVEYNGLSYE